MSKNFNTNIGFHEWHGLRLSAIGNWSEHC